MNENISVGWHKNVFISFVENWILAISWDGSFSDSHVCVCVGRRCKNRRCFIFLTLRKMEVDVFLCVAFLHLLKLHFHLKATNYSNYILLRPNESRTKGIQKKTSFTHTHTHPIPFKEIRLITWVHVCMCVCSSSRVLTNNNEANASIAEERKLNATHVDGTEGNIYYLSSRWATNNWAQALHGKSSEKRFTDFLIL